MRGINGDGGSLTCADDCFIPTSYRKILDHISEIPLAKAQFHFGTVMTSVETRTGDHAPVCVTDDRGKEQFFDEVVVTSPLGWLKRNQGSVPGLHPRIASAIESISFGRLEKVGNFLKGDTKSEDRGPQSSVPQDSSESVFLSDCY